MLAVRTAFVLTTAGLVSAAAFAQVSAPIPNFSFATAGWTTSIGGEFIPVPGSPGPVVADPRYPFLTNVESNARGKTPNYRIADLSNPNLKPSVKAAMKKDNDEVLAGKIAFTPSTSCVPSGVPDFLL